MPQFKLNKASCASADIFPSAQQRRKASKGVGGGELNALNAHLTALLLHFESLVARKGERPIVIHNRYPCGILNIVRADKNRRRGLGENGQERLRMARGEGGKLRLGLKIARQRCRSVRNSTSEIEIMAS